MVLVAYGETTVQTVGAHDDTDALRGLGGVGALRFCDEIAFTNTPMHQVVSADATFTEAGVGSRSSGGNHDGRQTTLEQVVSTIKAGAQDGGGMSRIFGGAEDYDGVGRVQF